MFLTKGVDLKVERSSARANESGYGSENLSTCCGADGTKAISNRGENARGIAVVSGRALLFSEGQRPPVFKSEHT
jgi:hypothetical protein